MLMRDDWWQDMIAETRIPIHDPEAATSTYPRNHKWIVTLIKQLCGGQKTNWHKPV